MCRLLTLRVALFGLVLSATLAQPVVAQQPTPELQALDEALPGRLINDPSRLDWAVYGPGQKHQAITGEDIPGGGAALQVKVSKAGRTAYEVGVNVPVRTAIRRGETLLIAFWARVLPDGTPDARGRVGVRFQADAAPYPGFGDTLVEIGPGWALHEVTAVADRDIDAGQAVVALQLSAVRQVVEIGQAIVIEGAASLGPKAAAAAGGAPPLPEALAGRGTLVNDPANRDWPVHGAGLTALPIAATLPGGRATAFEVAAATAAAHELGACVPLDAAIEEGDVLVVAVQARATDPAPPAGGVLGLRVQLQQAPYPGFGDTNVKLGATWRLVQLRTQAKVGLPAGQGCVALQLGGAAQRIEIGAVFVLREPAQ